MEFNHHPKNGGASILADEINPSKMVNSLMKQHTEKWWKPKRDRTTPGLAIFKQFPKKAGSGPGLPGKNGGLFHGVHHKNLVTWENQP